MTVIDASSLAKYILREDNWKKIREYLEDEVYSLNLALFEISNAIWKHYILYGKISGEEAMVAFEAAKILKDIVIFESFEDHLDNAMKISNDNKIPVYDALYISQAHKHGKMITSDKLQRDVADKMGIEVEYIE
ncbi:MAG TPA: PIN domain-containing protein [Thermoplasmatales archaeon]|nr:PIN domain-containing protein [Thermoplasmatales archaeon]